MTLKRCVHTMVLWLVVLLGIAVGSAKAEEQAVSIDAGGGKVAAYVITGIQADRSGSEFVLHILGSGLPTYTMYELFEPLRLVLDVAAASFGESVVLPLNFDDGPLSLIQGRTMTDKDPVMVRLEMLMTEQRSYSVEREGSNIVITFPNKATVITGIDVQKGTGETRVLIRANGAITEYYKEELPSDDRLPARMYLDFKDVVFAIPVQEQKVGTTLDRIRMASHQGGARIVFDSGLATDMFSYTIEPTAEGLAIVIQEAPAQVLEAGNKKRATPPKVPTTGDDKVIAPEGVTAEKKGRTDGTPAVAKIAKPAPADVFTLAGYEKQPITVDFYKIDLHNVFRLFGEISGLNIVVDEGVSGSLTLSLNNVPWDFALDIILNLKDLQKEERFNTIVISPKSKAFSWPERELDLLAVSADGTLTTVESLSVQKKIETPPEVVEAKKLMKMGREAEKEGDFSQALKHYEAAFALWSENGQLASRMASLFLARQSMNAKALHYAKAALGINKHDRNAALFAAISLANMKKTIAAKEYFDQAVSEEGGVKPAKEALTSYAIFNEENKNYVEALLLLARHEQLYGDSFETMVAKARIYDKEGSPERALAEYRAILLSGYELPPDLDRFIKGRLAMEKTR